MSTHDGWRTHASAVFCYSVRCAHHDRIGPSETRGKANPLSERKFPFDDFEAVIRIFSAAEGGRCTPLFNGIRCDFEYAEDPPHDTLYMICPDFMDENGDSRSNSFPLPIGEKLPARMMILSDELREQVHRKCIVPGVRFYCREGPTRIAEGVVTRITGLFEPRPAS